MDKVAEVRKTQPETREKEGPSGSVAKEGKKHPEPKGSVAKGLTESSGPASQGAKRKAEAWKAGARDRHEPRSDDGSLLPPGMWKYRK